MKLRKWNNTTENYEDYIVPDEWNVPIYSENMNEIVNCIQCGEKVKFGDSYTSLEVHTQGGFGYGVCPNCHEKELRRALEAIEK